MMVSLLVFDASLTEGLGVTIEKGTYLHHFS
jgi:hypothetical protein